MVCALKNKKKSPNLCGRGGTRGTRGSAKVVFFFTLLSIFQMLFMCLFFMCKFACAFPGFAIQIMETCNYSMQSAHAAPLDGFRVCSSPSGRSRSHAGWLARAALLQPKPPITQIVWLGYGYRRGGDINIDGLVLCISLQTLRKVMSSDALTKCAATLMVCQYLLQKKRKV